MVLNMTPEMVEKEKMYREMGLADKEYERAKQLLGRTPNYIETGIFAAMWSEHCSYKSSKPLLKRFPTEGPDVLMGPGEGAGVVDIGDGQAVTFKIESHNSPSIINPFEGAATGVGGILRDVFSMGARPISVMQSLRFGELGSERTNDLFNNVLKGIQHYSAHVDVPLAGGDIQFDDCYTNNPLVNAMAVGLLNHEDMQRGVAKGIGNTVLYAGAPTGRDGIHGATHSSDDKISEAASPATAQPELGRRLKEACLEVIHIDGLIGMQDMGAAGLTSSGSEMASKAGTGMVLNLDLVPQAEKNMSAYEMMLSETQERMLLVVEKGLEQAFIDVFKKYDVPVAHIGEVIQEQVFRIEHRGEMVANIPTVALDEKAPVYHLPIQEPEAYVRNQQIKIASPQIPNIAETFKQLLQQPTVASKQDTFLKTIKSISEKKQNLIIPSVDVSVAPIDEHDKSVAMTTSCNARYVSLDPHIGGQIAVVESAWKIICSGAKPLAITDGINIANPTNPEVFWQITEAVEGIRKACLTLETPVISGNVSMYNQTEETAIYPTPIIGMVGKHSSMDHVTFGYFQQAGDLIYVIGETGIDFAGSELQNLLDGTYEGRLAKMNLNLTKQHQELLLQAIQRGLIQSAQYISVGGMSVALAMGTTTTPYGVDVILKDNPVTALFSETPSRVLVSIKKENREQFEQMFPDAKRIGSVSEQPILTIRHNEKIVVKEPVKRLKEKMTDCIGQWLS